MSEVTIQPDELRKSAGEFLQAGKDTAAILKRLDDSTSELEKKWSGAARQTFFKQYKDLRQYMEAFSGLLENINVEMQAMADRFEQADK
jgi:WXG100 family type VII secretion target